MECLTCPKCYNYAYDTLIRPHPINSPFADAINLDPIIHSAHSLTHDFMRASLNRKEEMHLVILCVETGSVRKPVVGRRNPITMMRLWIQHRLHLMGNLNHLHFFHSGGYALEEHPPIQGPIRLRITCSEESITPVVSLRIRIPISENEFE
jgi:hypothetical protein